MKIRPAIEKLDPYIAGKSEAAVRRELGVDRVVKLGSNESPYGPFPAALEAIARHAGRLNRYPELDDDLAGRLAERHGVARDQILLGNGADAIIGYLSATYLNPGDEVLMGWPSFPTYLLDAVKMGAAPVTVPLRDGAFDLDAMAERIGPRTRLIYVCNPNNPTGGIVRRDALAAFVRGVPADVLVVLDEAYFEYVTDVEYPDGIAEHAAIGPNVAVLRTFSKLFGLAGLRIGYLVGPADIARDVSRLRHYFDVGELANVAALASLGDDAEIADRRAVNATNRAALADALAGLGLEPLPAHGNFIAARVGDGEAVAEQLLREGVIVRPLSGFGAPELLRTTVGTPEENAILVDALARVPLGAKA